MSEKSKAIDNVAKGITNDFESWINDLEGGEQPTSTCNIDGENCESCSG